MLNCSTVPHCPHHAVHLIGQFCFARGRHSHYPRRHDLDFVLPLPKLKPDQTQNLGISREMPKNWVEFSLGANR